MISQKNNSARTSALEATLLCFCLILAGCNSDDLNNAASTSGSSTGIPTKTYARDTTSCNPMGNGSTQNEDLNLGLAARLFYSANQGNFNNVEEYFTSGTDLGVDLFFNNVDVIPTYFSQGFPSEAGPAFTTPDGTVLDQWFAIRYASNLRLTANNQPGQYQIATLTDDGSIFYADVDNSGNLTEVVNNDGEHSTQMGCATTTINMAADSIIPIRLDYFQGPEYHLTNMLLWRFIPTGGSLSDPACGVQGINTFYDTTQTPAVPTAYYNDMLARGWQVIPAENFVLPDTNPLNPCFPGGPLLGN